MLDAAAITVVVSTDRDSPAVAEVVNALARQGADARVVRDITIAAARNRALADCRTEVVAYVDDDVVVPDGWLAALRQAWAAADADVGAIGGPIAGVRATVDYGDAPLELDAAERTLLAGNLSFRAEALRGVQGFWPMRGRAGVRDWFTEEHHAQRELAAAGWRVLYDPELRARRVARAETAAQRLRYGARLRAGGGARPAAVAARTAATSTAGAIAALLAGQRGRAAERAHRAAENLGVLVGGPVAQRDFEPSATSTPLRASVPRPVRRLRAPRRRLPAAILAYHRVATIDDDPLSLAVTPEHFAEQLAIIKREARPVALQELVEVVDRGRARDPVVAVTFDDAYADVVDNAAPALTAGGVPATLFVPTDPVARRRAFWWDELEACLRLAPPDAPPVLELTVGGERRSWVVRTGDQRRQARRHLHAWLQAKSPEAIERALDDLGAWAGERPQVQPPAAIEQLARFAEQPGLELGGHTRRHIRLRGADPRLQRAEIDDGLDAIADWTGRRPGSFAYPFGMPGVDFDAVSERIVAACGCAHAVAMAPAPLTRHSDRYALPRHVVPDVGGDAFAAWLRGLLR